MTTLVPREPYSEEELGKLYPKGLQLQLVQILLRHGERTPVAPRFQNAGLPAYWPYCKASSRFTSTVLATTDPASSSWDNLQWQRHLERFSDSDDAPTLATSPTGDPNSMCQPGELTDLGRQTTLALGQRLRNLYIQQLSFLPSDLTPTVLDSLYLRATPIPRALESLQQAFIGLYPPRTRPSTLPPPAIILRSPGDETLFPNEVVCRRLNALARAFGQRTADRHNTSPALQHATKLIGKYVEGDVRVDGKPRLSGILDTVNATLAHGPLTRLPSEFYDPQLRDTLERVNVEEWYSGYQENREYRMLGIGSLAADIVGRMVQRAEGKGVVRFSMSGCHDTTLAGLLSSLGAFKGTKWPPFTSHVAIELFRKDMDGLAAKKSGGGWFHWVNPMADKSEIGRKPMDELNSVQRERLDGYYVRLRYNDAVVTVPGCKAAGKHLEGDESFCTLEAFKAIVDKYTPRDWKQQCKENMGKTAFPEKPEPSGY
ncbi:phosphoglycerate mutase-like protein [Microthyrium microscopicum]|uniref:3-phytase n=1 Tax=Microthyrium microscopicum TaxID=703497 RepID=A0A6A6U108_9PEZI|nr:phosphoglycerate mutase-like protein [Microthyrium microscopicum]